MFFIYSITIFVNAALLFLIQPMIAKMILPFLGGSPAVWNMSLFFFQALLLAGYLYAHLGSSWLGTKGHAMVHVALVLFAASFLPVLIPQQWFSVSVDQPAKLVLSVLFASVGFPFFVLSAGSPLLQKWFASTAHPVARDPYFLYAASNLGSMVGLLAYPAILEPHFSLAEQSWSWFYGYLALIAFTSTCAVFLWRFFLASPAGGDLQNSPDYARANPPAQKNPGEVTFARRMRWVVFSLVPSSLLLGVTTYVTTDVASTPLFWIIPLALYLLSFVLTFSRTAWISHSFIVRRQGFLLLAAALTVFTQATTPVWILVPLHLIAFFATALVCHGELAKDRPPASYLTEFYLWISIGGVCGGFFNALLAPLIFKGVQEYPLAMIAAGMARPYIGENRRTQRERWLDLALPAALGLVLAAGILWSRDNALLAPRIAHLLAFGVSGVLCLSFAYRPLRFGLGMAAVFLVSSVYVRPYGELLYSNRSFFGVYRAIVDKEEKFRLLFQGTTIHGTQRLDPKRRLEPASYYYPTGPVGQVFSAFSKARQSGNVAIVGLGTGALACKGTPGQKFTFYEIDPLVEQIARDANLFTYLRDCPPEIKVVLGDARISLAQAPDRHYQLFVLDAFSSDVVPVHLLTREALQLYLSKLDENGILFFHISNRYMNLVPVLDRLASSLDLLALLRHDGQATRAERQDGKFPSRWVVMARHQAILAEFLSDPRWKPLTGRSAGDLWTDDYSNIFRVIDWN
ncbi:MAG: fused MFS/spermidine synthase [Candidatus Binatia bacterium]